MNQGMRSYTNKEGDSISVSKDHLETAIDIKLELQELNPSRKCNWADHKRLMEKEGFFDSDTCESYRCMIKNYQKQIGRLASVQKYADMVSDSKLSAIKSAIGEMYQEKTETQMIRNELNRIKRDLSVWTVLSEEIRNALLDELVFEIPHYAYNNALERSVNLGCVVITDWHIGAVVKNVYGNHYNFEIAKKRLDKLKQEVIYLCNTFNINNLTVIFNGDMIEHLNMRNVTQAFEAEFNMAQQISKSIKLIIDFIVSLSKHVNVEFGAIAGNHDRMNGDKNDNVDNDNVIYTIADSIKAFIESTGLPRLSFIDNLEDTSFIVKDFNGSLVKFVHGDKEGKNDVNKIRDHESLDGVEYKAIVMGHLHTYEALERNYGKWEIRVGSLMGSNTYSTTNFKGRTNAGQGMLVIRGDGTIMPFKIDLQSA